MTYTIAYIILSLLWATYRYIVNKIDRKTKKYSIIYFLIDLSFYPLSFIYYTYKNIK